MISGKAVVATKQGFHMRPATLFSAEMAKFRSSVTLTVNGKTLDGKSLMNLIAAAIKCGSEVTVSCDGEDEGAALEKALALIGTELDS